MVKGNKRGNREAKKPKQIKAVPVAAATLDKAFFASPPTQKKKKV